MPLLLEEEREGEQASRRISRRQLDSIQASLSKDDLEILHFVSELRLATSAQLRRRFMPSSGGDAQTGRRAARRAIHRLALWRVLDHLPERSVGGRHGGSEDFVWHVGVSGARLLQRIGAATTRLATPSERHVRHTLGVTELIVALTEADRAGELELIACQGEPRCWRRHLGSGGATVTLKPDAFLRIGAGRQHEDRWFVEYDLSSEGPATLGEKLRRHLAYRSSGAELREHAVDPRVLWLVRDAPRSEVLSSLISRLAADEQQLFAVATHAQAIEYIARQARS